MKVHSYHFWQHACSRQTGGSNLLCEVLCKCERKHAVLTLLAAAKTGNIEERVLNGNEQELKYN